MTNAQASSTPATLHVCGASAYDAAIYANNAVVDTDVLLVLSLVNTGNAAGTLSVVYLPPKDATAETPKIIVDANTTPLIGTSAVVEQLVRAYLPRAAVDDLLVDADSLVHAQIMQWLGFVVGTVKPAMRSGDQGAQKAFAKFLNDHLETRPYLATTHALSLADYVLYANVQPYLVRMTEKRRFEMAHFVRWFDLVQHTSVADAVRAWLPLVEINLDEPEGEAVSAAAAAPAAKDQANVDGAKGAAKGMKQQAGSDADGGDNTKKREKKVKPVKEKPQPVAEPPANDASRLDLRIGLITECNQHENADALYVEKIDLGEATGPRTVVSGLVKHIPVEEMRGRLVVVLCNLKPATMRGVKSEGMVLAATSAEGKVELLDVPVGSKPGERVVFEGFEEGTPDAQLNPKKKVWETIQPELFTNDARQPYYRYVASEGAAERLCLMKTASGGAVTVKSNVKATIK